MARKVSISFKETTKDLELYDLIMDMEDKSCEVKKILRESLIEMQNNKIQKEESNIKNSVNILDF